MIFLLLYFSRILIPNLYSVEPSQTSVKTKGQFSHIEFIPASKSRACELVRNCKF